jgi:hypothetical protein
MSRPGNPRGDAEAVREFFRMNPDEFLLPRDVCAKFDFSPSQARHVIQTLKREKFLVEFSGVIRRQFEEVGV